MLPIKLPIYNNLAPQLPLISVPLIGLSDIVVKGAELNEQGEFIIRVESEVEGTVCHKCKKEASQGHGYADESIVVRHLSVFGRPTYIHLRPKRFRCLQCGGAATTTQQVAWRLPRSPHTIAFEEHILLELVNSTVEDVSHKEGLGYDAVLGIIDRHIKVRVDWGEFKRLDVLGIDEIALKKGHRDYVVVITARLSDGQVKVLAILPNRKKKTVVKFLRSIPKPLRQSIHTVCSDMWKAYISAVKIVLPNADIVVDRFHVAQKYHQAADKLRAKELKRLKKKLSEKEYKKLKGAMWAFRKKKADLTDDETKVLTRLFKHSPKLKLAYQLREKLSAIFDDPLTKKQATEKIKHWRKDVEESELTCFNTFLTTLNNHLNEITNYFINRFNSGFVEGLNNKIKVLKRRCYGLLNLNHLFQRLFLDLEGYSLFP